MGKQAKFKGVFSLQTAEDLFRKLESDFERMGEDRHDPYAAFDFFVGAYHLIDWHLPGNSKIDKENRDKFEQQEILLQICSHLANGSKHFEATAAKHQSVQGTGTERGFGSGFSDDFDKGGLIVNLDGVAAATLGDKIRAVALAKDVLAFWKTTLKL